MGLYDDVRCDYPLPDPSHNALSFQTKTFDEPYMEPYRITAEGRLEKFTFDLVRTGKAPWPMTREEQDERGETAGGMLRRANERWEDQHYHGDLRFYTFKGEGMRDPEYEWIEYVARFTEGQLVRIWRDTEAR